VQEGGKPAFRNGEQFSNMLIGYAPGVPTITWDPDTAFLVKAGSTLLFQVHYTPNGKESVDRSTLGLKIRKNPPANRAFSGSATQFRIAIPPNDPSYEAAATHVFKEDVTLLDMTPHMHLRGKAFKYVITYPDGRSEELLNVPKYDFNWQLSYILAEPRQVPAGSKIEATAWYDNSANNKYNPDPSKLVKWGDQTFEEMMIGFFNYKVPTDRPEPARAPQQPRLQD
jgi:Copper type II ascorbate-dependent monooxygenase, C-terminal domain